MFTSQGTTSPGFRTRRHGFVSGVAVAGVVSVGLLGVTAPALAATDGGSTDANVEVGSSIVLSGLTDAFTLTGIPGANPASVGAVTMNVETNNLAGYAVTVQGHTATLTGATAGNTDTIPVESLSVRETGTTSYTPLSSTVPVTVHSQEGRSAEFGDALSNDYTVDIPFVSSDTYTATLDYVAATL